MVDGDAVKPAAREGGAIHLVALTRAVSPSLARCELTHVPREPIDVARARRQHQDYERRLAALGCEVRQLPAAPDLPDSVFIEDICVVLDELAVITRPGTEARRPETRAVAEALKPDRPLASIAPPGTLDGGDVLCLGKRVFVGQSSRSNQAGIDQLRRLLDAHGYTVTGVPVHGCLHLKSAVTQVGPNTVLVNRAWVDPAPFGEGKLLVIDVDPAEPDGANALFIAGTAVYPTTFPRTRARLEHHGITVETVDVSELQKAEGAVTCCSVVFQQVPLRTLA